MNNTSSTGSLAVLVTAELARLTSRDKLICELLAVHHTLTTDQLAEVVFGSLGRARNRLAELHRRGILDRFRHYHRPGTQSWRWTLGPVGAAIRAAAGGEAFPRPATVRAATARLAASPHLDHLIGTNGFFTALHAHARAHPGTRVVRWWSEATCRTATGGAVRPDALGVWADGRRRVPFWLEYDTGTETVARVAAKLSGYAQLAGSPWAALSVLVFTSGGARRETALHAALARAASGTTLNVATATADAGGPAGPVWRRIGHGDRVALADLPAAPVPADDGPDAPP
ncbi:replication-relaxation family protein [Pilimelia terevasa]|uniref:replication-relaxation family protein n=1 Tax=Pilimelia terevasa TaxID=53372 RepID=UPI00166E44E7|nr:replication-relaxation family protein [Pilimelia terevasa]